MKFASGFDEFHEMARKATGFDDFGDRDYVEPMKLLLSDYDRECKFTPFGEQYMKASCIGQLIGRLFTQHNRKKFTEYANVRVERPLFIIGMMRTGTTALHRLLAQDPANQTLPQWLGATPMPRPPRQTWEGNPWYQRAAQGLEQFYQLAPNLKLAHPIAASEPDECRHATDHTFWAPGMMATATVPAYTEWFNCADAGYAYRYYQHVLELVAGGSRQRWVLKDPDHLFGLQALLDVFPDACIVFTHRDITAAMTSGASLLYDLRQLTHMDSAAARHDKKQLTFWGQALDKAEKVRQRHDPARFFDVHANQLQADPIGTVEAIYRYFNFPFDETSRRVLTQYVDTDPKHGHVPHRRKSEDFGFTEQDVFAAIGGYYARYAQISQLA